MPVEVAEKPHAILGASKWDQWGNCSGSIPLTESLPHNSSIPLTESLPHNSSGYAREGNAAHALLEDCIIGGFDAEDLLGREYVVEGELFVVDMDMADAVNTAIGWVRDEIDEERGDVLMVEQMVPIAHLTGETDAEGTSDVIGIVDGGKTLVVMDYKHGRGVQVYASEKPDEDGKRKPNGQMAMYALGALELVRPFYDQIEKVRMVIMQPRMDWHDGFDMTTEELLAFGEIITQAAGRVELNRQLAAEGQELDLNPTDKGCRFCAAKSFCPALRNMMTNTLAIASDAADFDDLTLPKKAASVTIHEKISNEKLAEMMRAIPLIEAMFKDVRAEVERRLFAGENVPGFYLGEGKKGNRKWRDETIAAIELTKGGRLKADEAFTKKVISPTQAEKLLKSRPKIWSKVAPLITQDEGKPSVCKEGDGNPVYVIGNSADAFEDLTAAPENAAIEAPAGDNPFA